MQSDPLACPRLANSDTHKHLCAVQDNFTGRELERIGQNRRPLPDNVSFT